MLHRWINRSSVVLFLTILTSTSAHANLQVFACEPEWAALVKSLGGEHVKVYTATTNQQDPHHIQARPSLIAKARRADLLVCTGAELEVGWLPLLLRKSANARIQTGQPGHFMASNYVSLLGKPLVLDRSLGDVHAAGNPHVHLDPMRLLQIAEALSQTLINIDAAHQVDYQENLSTFTQSWKSHLNRWRKLIQPIQGESIIVHHNSWMYLQEWIGLSQLATLEPKPGIPPSSTYLSQLLSKSQLNNAYGIVYASFQNDKAANWLSQKTGIPSVALDFSPAKGQTLPQWFEGLIQQLLKVQN